jgi:hypothetical protein
VGLSSWSEYWGPRQRNIWKLVDYFWRLPIFTRPQAVEWPPQLNCTKNCGQKKGYEWSKHESNCLVLEKDPTRSTRLKVPTALRQGVRFVPHDKIFATRDHWAEISKAKREKFHLELWQWRLIVLLALWDSALSWACIIPSKVITRTTQRSKKNHYELLQRRILFPEASVWIEDALYLSCCCRLSRFWRYLKWWIRVWKIILQSEEPRNRRRTSALAKWLYALLNTKLMWVMAIGHAKFAWEHWVQ